MKSVKQDMKSVKQDEEELALLSPVDISKDLAVHAYFRKADSSVGSRRSPTLPSRGTVRLAYSMYIHVVLSSCVFSASEDSVCMVLRTPHLTGQRSGTEGET